MPDDILIELRGCAALLALLLLPGLAAARARWTAVPFLSASFWISTWWWLPGTSSRRFFLAATLSGFALLVLPRVLRWATRALAGPSLRWGTARWPAALVLGAALAGLAPFGLWAVAPGAGMSFHSLSALLMVWRDGLPRTFEPLLPMGGFGAHDPGLDGLAADVSLLSGLPPARAVLLASLGGGALLHVALFALLARGFGASAAALAAVSALGLAGFGPCGAGGADGPAALALAFLCAGAALAGPSPARAVALGALIAAALLAHPATVATGAFLALPMAGAAWRRAPGPGRRVLLLRAALAFAVVLLACAPFLWRLLPALRRGGPRLLVEAAPSALPLFVIALAFGLAACFAFLRRRCPALVPLAGAALLAAAAGGAARGFLAAQAGLAVGAGDLAAMAWLRAHTRPGEVVCNEGPAAAWIPALAGRGIAKPELPALYQGTRGRPARSCSWTCVSQPEGQGSGRGRPAMECRGARGVIFGKR